MGLLYKLTNMCIDRYFNGWATDIAIRYLPIVRKIKHLGLTDAKILEVGSGSIGIVPYLKRRIVGVDTNYSETPILVEKVEGTATNLPFEDRHFDIVISVDMLEHLRPEERKQAISEMIRVAEKIVFIAVPCGEKSVEQDLYIDTLYKKIYKKRFPFCIDHISNGLPNITQILEIFKKLKGKYRLTAIRVSKNANLLIRRFYMKAWIEQNYRRKKLFLLLIPLLKYIHIGECYRRIFTIYLNDYPIKSKK